MSADDTQRDKARALIREALRPEDRRLFVNPADIDIDNFPILAEMGVKLAEPGEEFSFVVCLRCDDEHPLMALDNETSDCSRCGSRVQHRPKLPPGEILCLECFHAGGAP